MYSYPSASYFSKLLNVYVLSLQTGVTPLTVSVFPFAVLVNVNVISLALSCDFPPSTHVFVPLIVLSSGSIIVFVML